MKYVDFNDDGNFTDSDFDVCEVERNPEETFLFFGSLASVILPQIICFVYGGIFLLIVSAVSVLIGVAVGFAAHHFRGQFVSCFDKAVAPEIDWHGNRVKKNWLNNYPKISVR